MDSNVFSPMEVDAIGEILNISLGSSATAVSNMLDRRVDISTPTVNIVTANDFSLGNLQPAIGVEINYVAGLTGSNIMLLKRRDIKTIVDILMGTETPDEDFELNELVISAVCEVMNQMMGAASTALSDFLGKMVNISTPVAFEITSLDDFKVQHFPKEGVMVVVRFILRIEDSLESEFMSVLSADLARELVAGFGIDTGSSSIANSPLQPETDPAPAAEPAPASSSGGTMSQEEIEKLMGGMAAESAPASSSGGTMSQEEIEKLMGGMAASAPAPAPASSSGGTMSQEEIEKLMSGMSAAPAPAPAPAAQGGTMSQEEIEKLMGGMAAAPAAAQAPAPQVVYVQAPAPQVVYAPAPQQPKVIDTQQPNIPQLDPEASLSEEQAKNLDLIMSVPLELSVEIGRTRRKVKEILGYTKGSLVVLDKLAGDQVDLYVNGRRIACGDVVVVNDNFGIRITEILDRPNLSDL